MTRGPVTSAVPHISLPGGRFIYPLEQAPGEIGIDGKYFANFCRTYSAEYAAQKPVLVLGSPPRTGKFCFHYRS